MVFIIGWNMEHCSLTMSSSQEMARKCGLCGLRCTLDFKHWILCPVIEGLGNIWLRQFHSINLCWKEVLKWINDTKRSSCSIRKCLTLLYLRWVLYSRLGFYQAHTGLSAIPIIQFILPHISFHMRKTPEKVLLIQELLNNETGWRL